MLTAELIQTILQERGPKLRAALERATPLITAENAAELADAALQTLRSGSAESLHTEALVTLVAIALAHAPSAVRASLEATLAASPTAPAAEKLRELLP